MGLHVIPMPGNHVEVVPLILGTPTTTTSAPVLLCSVEHIRAERCLRETMLGGTILVECPFLMAELVPGEKLEILTMIDIFVARGSLRSERMPSLPTTAGGGAVRRRRRTICPGRPFATTTSKILVERISAVDRAAPPVVLWVA